MYVTLSYKSFRLLQLLTIVFSLVFQVQRTKKLGNLIITAESSVSEIEEIVRDGQNLSTFFLTTPGRVLHLFGSKLVRISLPSLESRSQTELRFETTRGAFIVAILVIYAAY